MTSKPVLTQSPNVPVISIQSYERYLPSAFDESLSILQKMNLVINQLNSIGEISNSIVTQWNDLMKWLIGNGLSEVVSDEIDKRIADGTFNDLIINVIGDLSLLETIDKSNVVNAINEVNKIAVDNDLEMGDITNLTTTDKTNIVSAINELKSLIDIYNQATISIGEATGHGVISGLKVRQQNVLSMAVEIGNATDPNIIHMKNGARYTPSSLALPVNPSHATLDRKDIVFVSVSGDITYLSGTPSLTPITPTLPNGAELLAEIFVVKTDTTVNDVDITDKRSLKSLSELKTNVKDNFVLAINEVLKTTEDAISSIRVDMGDKNTLNTVNKTTIVSAINEVISLHNQDKVDLMDSIAEIILKMGLNSNLNTVDKSTIVNAINEIILNNSTDKQELLDAIDDVLINIDDVLKIIGDKTKLKTFDKTSIVVAINEVVTTIGSLTDLDTTDKTSIVSAINEVKEQIETEVNNQLSQNMSHVTEVINVKKLPKPYVSAKGDGVTDDTTAFRHLIDYIKSLPNTKARVIFPSGVYVYSESPNWAVTGAEFYSEGEVRLRYTGTENAVVIDGEQIGQHGMFNMVFSNFIVEAPPTAKNGVYIRAVHHSRIDVKVRGAGVNYAGVRIEFAVCSEFNITCSANDDVGGWYMGAKPKYGIFCTKRDSSGEGVCYCTFYNPVLEWCAIGGYLDYSMGNTFLGGTMEGCSMIGLQVDTNAFYNNVIGCDFEHNTNQDIYCRGYENTFFNCDSFSQSTFDVGSKRNVVNGGTYSNISIIAGTSLNTFMNVNYNRHSNGGGINDSGEGNRMINNVNTGLQLRRFDNGIAIPNSVDPRTDIGLLGDSTGFYFGEVKNKTGYPQPYGSIEGYANAGFDYKYSWQEFHGMDAKIKYRRYAISATQWSDFMVVHDGTVPPPVTP